ncbi:MAG: glutaredoxin family protein [Actinomycetota bacterium]
MVAALALLAAATGFCAGCELYKLGARLRGYGETLQEIDLADLDVEVDGEVTVLFTHPLCTDCHEVKRQLSDQGLDWVRIDVRTHRHLARKHGISVVPTVVSVDSEERRLWSDRGSDLTGSSHAPLGCMT